jgi:hypothetical protein
MTREEAMKKVKTHFQGVMSETNYLEQLVSEIHSLRRVLEDREVVTPNNIDALIYKIDAAWRCAERAKVFATYAKNAAIKIKERMDD